MHKNNIKQCFKKFIAGITVLLTEDEENDFKGMTCTAFSAVSLEPPLVLNCLNKSSKTNKKLLENEIYTISILNENQEMIANHFAGITNKDWQNDKYIEKISNNQYIVKDSLAYFICKKDKVIDAGDHNIFIGEIIDCNFLNNDLMPLSYFQSTYTKIKPLK
jgi:flavin reductase (DIM6/NTAB) family NADH-FMN oxidoreductase RutF